MTPAQRAEKAQRAGRATRDAYAALREARGERYATRGVAYTAGYRAGYQACMTWWRRKFTRELAAVRGSR